MIGVIPRSSIAKEVAYPSPSQLHAVRTMHERKAMIEQLSDGSIALPGCYETYDETFEGLA